MQKIKRTGRTDMEPFWNYNRTNKQKEQGLMKITIRDKEGNRIEDTDDILKAYEEYYKELLKTRPAKTNEEKETEEIMQRAMLCLKKISRKEKPIPTTEEEIVETKKTLKTKKAGDSRGWQNEHLLYGGGEMIRSIQKLSNMIDKQQETPEKWEDMWIKQSSKIIELKSWIKQEDCS